jgi:hypothetical protein
MSATFEFNEDNGAATGSPAKGTTRSTAVTQMNWKSTDDVGTAYASSPINAGQNSYTKYQFGQFTGSFTQISDGKWSHTLGTMPSNTSLFGAVLSTYATPSQTSNAALVNDMTTITPIASGQTVLFSTVGPEGASPTSTLSAAGYTQYLATQIRTNGLAASGDSGPITLTLRYNEN